jgi:hypothetical protein
MQSVAAARDLLEQAGSLLRAVSGAELAGTPGAELADVLLTAQRVAHMAHAAVLHASAAFDASGEWERDGAASAGAWLRARADLPPGAARTQFREARLLRDVLPGMRQALVDGRITPAHVRVVAAVCEKNPERRSSLAHVEGTLVEAAAEVDPVAFRQLVERWTCAVDPVAAALDDDARHSARALSASRTFGGAVAVDGTLDPEGGSLVLEALRAVMERDRSPGDSRTPRQRRADALVALCREALGRGELPHVAGVRPHVQVTIPIEVVLRASSGGAELEGAGPVTADAALRLLCDSSLVPVLEGADGAVLDVGRARRTIPPALRRAIVRRDRTCVFAGCDQPQSRCEVHHLVEWAQGGSTSQDNCVLLCHRHHRALHQEGFAILGTPRTGLRTVRPDGTRIPDRRIDHRALAPPHPPDW